MNMNEYVLDSFALLAYFQGEKPGKGVIDLLDRALCGNAALFACVVNWGEGYYITLREQGVEKAELYRSAMAEYPITLVEAGIELTLQAARYKAFHKMSFADAFAAALAKVRQAELVTGDPEFKPLEREIRIHWI